MDWKELTIHTTTFGSEVVSDILMEAGAGGTVIEDRDEMSRFVAQPRDWDMVEDSVLSSMTEDVLVRAWVEEDERLLDRLSHIRTRLGDVCAMVPEGSVGSLALELVDVRGEDWVNSWKKYYKPFNVGERLLVCPVWEDADPQGRTVLKLEPGMAFGSGTHETTFMCLELGEKYVREGMRVADIGCGTGILGVAAALLNAGVVVAADRDPIAVDAARMNAQLNNVDIDVRESSLYDAVPGEFDLIFANIIADVIMAMAKDTHERLAEGGIFICSGIIRERRDEVRAALQAASFEVLDVLERGEWAAMALRKL